VGYSYCHNCRLGPVAPSPLERGFLFPVHVGFVFLGLFLLVFVCGFLLLCGLVVFEASYWGTLVLLWGIVVLPFGLGILALCVHFVIGNVSLCFVAFFAFLYLFGIADARLFSLTFQRTLGSFMTVAFCAS
jgi:hypothetical protein